MSVYLRVEESLKCKTELVVRFRVYYNLPIKVRDKYFNTTEKTGLVKVVISVLLESAQITFLRDMLTYVVSCV